MVIPLNNPKNNEAANFPSCRKCNTKLDRIPRGLIVKGVLFWLPVKRYICFKCNKKMHLWGK